MPSYFCDLHIHIGRSRNGQPIKISASDQLTFENIAREASERKGIDLIGIIDCHSPPVLDEIEGCLERGVMTEIDGGGIRYGRTTILPGAEIEVKEPDRGPAHLLVYMPCLAEMRSLSDWMAKHMTNVSLSSQRIYVPAQVLQEEAVGRGGMVIPAHIFTPHKSIYGSAADRMDQVLDPEHVHAVELGLSADSAMAGQLSELDRYAFLTNSDAHSLGKIAREYNQIAMDVPNFEQFGHALAGREPARIEANYGLNPHLGKYHRTWCRDCEQVLDAAAERVCPRCGSRRITGGVMDRIARLADRTDPESASARPPYRYQVPLEFIPGLGRRTLDRLLDRFGTEMNVVHRASFEALEQCAGESVARYIMQARDGDLQLQEGGGGRYGKVRKHGRDES